MIDPSKAQIVFDWAHNRPLITCRVDSQSRYVFCGGEEGTLNRFAFADGAKTSLAGGHESWVWTVALTPAGDQLLSGGADGRLVWWESAAAEPKPLRTVPAHQGWIRTIAVSPDGTLAATGGNDLAIRLWKVADGSLVREWTGHSKDIYSILFHPNGQQLFAGDLLGVIKVWDVASGADVGTFDAAELHSFNDGQSVHFGGVRSLALSPDQKQLIAGGLYKATNPLGNVHEPLVLRFDVESKKLLGKHFCDGITNASIWRILYLPDGTIAGVCGGNSGGILLFWKTEAEKEFFRYKLPNMARDLDATSDGIHLVTVHHDGHVRVTRISA